MFWNTRHESSLAIDLSPDAVRVLEVLPRHGTPAVSFFAGQSVAEGPPDSLPDRQIEALRELLSTHRVRTRRAVAAMPTGLAVTRAVQVDRNKPVSVEEQIVATLQNCLPFDVRDLVFDHWPTAETPRERHAEYIVVATQKSLVYRYMAGFDRLGLSCAHLDVAPCAVADLIARSIDTPEATTGTVVLSAAAGFFAIVERGRVLFWRPFEMAGSPKSGLAGGGIDRVGDEISKCVSHMVGAMHVDTLGELLIYGHGSDDLAVTEYLNNRFHLNVRSPSPFEALGEAGMSQAMRESVNPTTATHFHTAVGLALQCAAQAA